jgi:hypothetical protein
MRTTPGMTQEIKEKKKNSKCHKCGRKGHWAQECAYKDVDQGEQKKSDGSNSKKSGGLYKVFMANLSKFHSLH